MSQSVADPASGMPIGPEVSAHAARRPERQVIEGRFVRLEPLDPGGHGASLWRETHGPDKDALWRYLFEGPFADERAFRAHLTRKAASEDPLFFAIVERSSARTLGYATLMRIDPAHRCIEVGNILYGPGLQRTPGGTEAQLLLMRYVFDDLGYRRYEWKCNALNAPSRRAAVRFGVVNGLACAGSCWALMLAMAVAPGGHLWWAAALGALQDNKEGWTKTLNESRLSVFSACKL